MREYELICLALEEIRKQTYIADGIITNSAWLEQKVDNEVSKKLLNANIEGMKNILEHTRVTLWHSVLSGIIEHNENSGAITAVDYELSKVPIALITGEKKAEDYE